MAEHRQDVLGFDLGELPCPSAYRHTLPMAYVEHGISAVEYHTECAGTLFHQCQGHLFKLKAAGKKECLTMR